MDELFEVLSLTQTERSRRCRSCWPAWSYWRRAFDRDFSSRRRHRSGRQGPVLVCESAEEAWQGILRWYQAAGRPLFRLEKSPHAAR